MKRAISILFILFLFFFCLDKTLLSQTTDEKEGKILLNGMEKQMMLSSSGKGYLGALSTIVSGTVLVDSTGAQDKVGYIRALYGVRYNQFEFHGDIEIQSEKNLEISHGWWLKQIYFQINNVLKLPVNILIGRFRTSAAGIEPYPYEYDKRAVPRRYFIGGPFFGQYANGFKLVAEASSVATISVDLTGSSQVYGTKPSVEREWPWMEASVGLYVIPSHHVQFSTGGQISREFRRFGSTLDWYNKDEGIFFFNGSFFIESSNKYESFLSYNAMTGVRIKNFEYHIGIENGFNIHGLKKSFINNGIRVNVHRYSTTYALLADYQVPIESSREWKVNLALLIFTDF
ncbi:hypothetical protein KKH87_01220 [Patescibacteria group bacterium]|nr:hypothetical protein [Patescibacteria group bacterium]MBU4057822.1 hypothetical protein [Patescibacteria group bacterium]MBU4116061.1 hypothetical protein [Patescibacteria group bacterium]